jgi:hypothetical protein
VAVAVSIAALGGIGGCDALNPAFVETVLPADLQGPVVTENAKGHVPILFVNNTRFEGALLQYMKDVGIDTSDPNLRPRVRLIADVAFADGSSRIMEFLDGSPVIQTAGIPGGTPGNPTPQVTVPPDLTQPALINQVVQCDVAAIAVRPQSIEVFVPVYVEVLTYETVGQAGNNVINLVLSVTYPPRYWQLQVDEVDEFLNATIVRNFGVRDIPGPVLDLTCGSAVLFELEGAMDVPFVGGVPGFIDADVAASAAFPGRYRMVVSVR